MGMLKMEKPCRRVAVITRTKNRKILLYRALESVCKQTFQDFQWVIVNDGGAREEVEPVLAEARKRHPATLLVNHETSRGMEAASNAGIAACDSEYIVIHDDDDSWEPEFLEKCVRFLDTERLFDGVITHTLLVNEVLKENGPHTTSCYGFNTWLKSVYLMEVLMVNSFPPISFLYRRSAYDAIGGYDETLPVLGDWDFNIRFLEKFDIGVIPELLALYHHRDTITDPDDVYGNTVNAGIQQHVKYDAILRNRYFRRQSGSSADGALGLLANFAVMSNWQNSKIDKIGASSLVKGSNRIIDYLLEKFSWFRRLKKKIKGIGGKKSCPSRN